MSPHLTTARNFILETFAHTGHSPSLEDIRVRFDLTSTADADALVDELERAGAIHRNDGDTAITHAYPFSNEPTAHRVQLAGGPRVYAMCAIDALGMPYMLKRDAAVTSACEHCGGVITVRIESQRVVERTPADIVVWFGTVGDGCVLATDLCPNLNFFCSADHLKAWQAAHPASDGAMMTFDQAVARGRLSFENLMQDGNELRVLEPQSSKQL